MTCQKIEMLIPTERMYSADTPMARAARVVHLGWLGNFVSLDVGESISGPDTMLLVKMRVPHRDTLAYTTITGSYWPNFHVDKASERGLHDWICRQVEHAVCHEIREQYRVHGERVLDPHAMETSDG